MGGDEASVIERQRIQVRIMTTNFAWDWEMEDKYFRLFEKQQQQNDNTGKLQSV